MASKPQLIQGDHIALNQNYYMYLKYLKFEKEGTTQCLFMKLDPFEFMQQILLDLLYGSNMFKIRKRRHFANPKGAGNNYFVKLDQLKLI